jgi:PAS domain S-box-containing protein
MSPLRSSEERFANVFRSSPIPMAIVGLDGRHLDVNESWLRSFGYSREEVIGRTPQEFGLFLARSEETIGILQAIWDRGRVGGVEMQLRTRTGVERIGLVSVELLDLGDEPCALSTFVDITERKRAESRTLTQYALTRLLTESAALEEAVPSLLETIGRGLGWHAGELWQVDPASGLLACTSTWAVDLPDFRTLSAGVRFVSGEGLPGRARADREPLWIRDVAEDPRFLRGPATLEIGLRSAVAVPIASGSFVFGVMLFFGREVRAPDEDLARMMADLGTQIGQFVERCRAEEALRTTTRLYERLVHSIDGIVWEADAQTFAFSFVSSQAERLLGYPIARWTDEPTFWLDHLHPEDRTRAIAHCLEATTALRDHVIDYRMIRADGGAVWIRDLVSLVVEDGRAVKLRGVMLDNTEWKRHEEEREHLLVREQEARREAEATRNRLAFLAEASRVLASSLEYRATLANVARLPLPHLADGASICLFRESGEIERAGGAFADPAVDREAQVWADRRPVDPASDHPAAVVRRTGEPILMVDAPGPDASWIQGDASYLAFLQRVGLRSLIAAPMRAHGRVLGALVLLRTAKSERQFGPDDVVMAVAIAERAALAIENAGLYAAAREANRLKDEFLATLSHELRTPLNAIVGWTQLLREGALDEVEAAGALESIEQNADLQTRLVSDLLDVSRIVTGKLSLELGPIDPTTVVLAAVETVRPTAEAKGVDLEVTLEPSVPRVDGDPDRLQQVAWNLLSNAVKFTPWGGRVAVCVRRSGREVEIRVQDTGEGVPADFLPHLFERFRQADSSSTRPHGGLGLGLALARHLVELHGGTIEAASPGPGRGSSFVVRLPFSTTTTRDGS